MSAALVITLIVLAIGIGYMLGKWYTQNKNLGSSISNLPWPQKRYYEGLTYLLNEQPDAAIDTFIAALEVNNDTLETHLALGKLLRKRGEISRAIRIHQNLLTRPGLNLRQMRFVQLELAIDYLKSGLLDRAEAILKELIDLNDIDKELRTQATKRLLEIYQELKEWLLAIDVADRLTTRKFGGQADNWRQRQAQYSCEIADTAIEEEDWTTCTRWLRTALRYDKNCVRANLLLASMHFKLLEYDLAINRLRQVASQDERFTPETLAPMFECYKRIEQLPELCQELNTLYESSPELEVLRYLAKAKEAVEGAAVVVELLLQELPSFPHMEPAAEILKIVIDEKSASGLRNYVRIKSSLEKLSESQRHYQCEKCGFEGQQLHWLCPSCKSWSSISLTPSFNQNNAKKFSGSGTSF